MTAQVRFWLDGKIVTLTDVDPTRTVLQYLREDLYRCGTKEGCAEGDCGACMVVVGSLSATGAAIDYRAVNACIQFLATLDGKALFTIESLSPVGGPLHPVQQAMVDQHGSQCGFCTPGFVMTLFAAYQHGGLTDRRSVDDALAGNLCRCTGYRPIVDAALAMQDLPREREHEIDEAALIAQLQALRTAATLETGHGARRFSAPTSVDALGELIAANPDACILAGGTDVGLWVTKQYRELAHVIYVGNVAALKTIETTPDWLEIGAAVTFTDAMPALLEHYPTLAPLLRRFASPPIRNMATIGGNIANGSPIGDSMPALIALGTRVILRRGNAARELALEDLYHDYQVNDLQPGEFVAHIRIPRPSRDQRVHSYKLSKRFDQDISAVCAAFALRLDDDRIADARVAYGGVAGIPARAPACEAALAGARFDEATVRRAMAALDDDFKPLSDMRASADYRTRTARNLLYRFFLDVTRPEVGTDVYDYGR